ncbi:MAG: glycoside hydrolase family 44 protein [Puia sp.]|nr:glycoside hydrolase family 44 protein [Puia sp.]
MPCTVSTASSALTVYGDALNSAWADWSWDVTDNFAATSPVHSGKHSIAATITSGWGGLYLAASPAISSSPYDTLQFWVNGGSSGSRQVRVMLADGNYNLLSNNAVQVSMKAGVWTQVTLKLSSLAGPAQIGGIVWQDTSGAAQPTFYLDDISLSAQGTPPPGKGPNLSIDAGSNRHVISPDIYGMNFAGATLGAALKIPVQRWGGNSTTRYNWQTNVFNTGSDWYFENIPESTGGAVANGSASDLFVQQNIGYGAQSIITVPLLGWTPRAGSPADHPYDCGYKTSKYGDQMSTDPWDTDCGNGVLKNGHNVTGNNPLDTSTQIDSSFVTQWIGHLTGKFGYGLGGGVEFYELDNEPMLWNSTHRDVHPSPTTYDELLKRTLSIAPAIKSADGTAKTLGPVVWGWCAYLYSALDGCSAGSDYQKHGNTYLVPWYLQQMQSYEKAHGIRILDYLDVHYYPASDNVALSDDVDSATQALRLRSTRSLWDPTYKDESWISQTQSGGVSVQLIPRMKQWVSANYPSTKLSISEYNWGALGNINGALAEADVLGIFGREGLDLATLWSPPGQTDPGAFAFRMYRNYNGAGGAFGDINVQAASTNQDQVSVYAAQNSSNNALMIMAINKTAGALSSKVTLSNFTPQGSAAVYQYSQANLSAVVHAPNLAVTSSGFTAVLPGNSITLYVLAQLPAVTVKIAPTSATVQVGKTRQFTATVTGTSNTSVTWRVNGVAGGNNTIGVVSASGLYTAPSKAPNPAVVTVSCVLKADTTKSASAKVTVAPAATAAVGIAKPKPRAFHGFICLAFKCRLMALALSPFSNGGKRGL